MKKLNWPLLLILTLHISLGVAFGLTTPIFEAPDEDAHYLFVRYLQVHHTLPVQDLNPFGPRAHHPPLYFGLAALISAWVPNADLQTDRVSLPINPHVDYRYGDPHLENKAMWVHNGPDERWPYAGQALEVHLQRLLSAVFSALGVWLTYLTARQLRPRDPSLAWLAAGLLAFNPMVLFMSGVVQNSTTAIASTAVVLYLLARFARPGFRFTHWLWVGGAWAAGILLQTSALALAAPIGVVLIVDTWRAYPPRALALSPVLTWARQLFARGLLLLLPVVVIDGWWFVRNQILYGDWTANAAIGALWSQGGPVANQPLGEALYLVGTGVVGRFGQGLMIDYPVPIYVAAGLLTLLAGAGLFKWAVPAWRSRRFAPAFFFSPSGLPWSTQIVTSAAIGGSLVVYVLQYIHGVHGRYLFPAFPALALLLAAGALAWFQPRWRAGAAVAVVGLNLGLALYGLAGLLAPTYAMPRSPTAAELRQMTPLDAQIGDVARVLGYTLTTPEAKPGQDLTVTVYWQPLGRTDKPYTVFVHLFNAELGSLAQRDIYPGAGNYATTVWDVGRTFVDTYRLSLPPDTPAVANAQILLGLYDEQTMLRLPVTGQNAGPAEDAWVEFGNLQVVP